MAWLKIYQSIREHRKILDAADDLEIEPPHMIGQIGRASCRERVSKSV